MFDVVRNIYKNGKKEYLLVKANELYWPDGSADRHLPDAIPTKAELEKKHIEYAALKGVIIANDNKIITHLVSLIAIVASIAGVYFKSTGDSATFVICMCLVAFAVACVYIRDVMKSSNARKYAIKECYYVDYFARVKTLEGKNKATTNTADLAVDNKDDKTGPI